MNPDSFDVLDSLMGDVQRQLGHLRDDVAYLEAGGAEVDATLTEEWQVHRLKRGSRRGAQAIAPEPPS